MKQSTFDINTIGILLINEVRLRSRRLSSLFALLLMVAISWSMIPDPQSGMVMMALDDARVAYTSSALAFGSASQASFLLSLICFYLLRGRMSEDIRTGIGSIIATSSIKNSVFIISRWLGGVAYILMLMLAFMAVILVLHLVRGEGGIQIEIYLLTYFLFFLPMAFATSAFAILFDSIPFLMGKVGDIIYFIFWVIQIGWLGAAISTNGLIGNGIFCLLLDFNGFGAMVSVFKFHLNTTSFSLGYSDFNAALKPIILPSFLWTYQIVFLRLLSAFVAMIPLLIAMPFFHRFSPDKVKASLVRERRSPFSHHQSMVTSISKAGASFIYNGCQNAQLCRAHHCRTRAHIGERTFRNCGVNRAGFFASADEFSGVKSLSDGIYFHLGHLH